MAVLDICYQFVCALEQTSMSPNSNISDETLFGYLLIALPEAEQWRIEALAFSDPVLRQRIEDLRDLLEPMRDLSDPIEPRSDLTASTMAFIERESQRAHSEVVPCAAVMSPSLLESDRASRLGWFDSMVALAAGIIILAMLLPSVWYSREAARRNSCAANLRELGQMFSVFAQFNSDHRLPRIEASGPLAFAGIYSIRLKDAGLLESPKWLWCPGVKKLDIEQDVPSIQMFLNASASLQESWKRTVGGTYSYNLGNVVSGNYETPSYGKSYFPILGDSLLPIHSDGQTAVIHGENLVNVLYDDGRIQLIQLHPKNAAPLLDNPYLNLDMQQAVGHGHDDSCLGPSYQNPFWPVRLE